MGLMFVRDVTSLVIKRASHSQYVFYGHMCINHGGLEITVSEQLLDCPDIIAIFQQMCGKTMSQRVNIHLFRYSRLLHCCLERPILLFKRIIQDSPLTSCQKYNTILLVNTII